jgi:DNA-binding MarR family transcriptional regulator
MSSTIKVQNTHISEKIRELHGSLIDIVTLMNQPQRDEAMVREAGIALDRALFPLLVGIERRGPIGIVDLAAGVGRDYTTVSRQVAKLESLGLAERRQSEADRRVNEAVITSKGKAMTNKIDAARERIALAVFATWEPGEINDLVRLMRKFADAMGEGTRPV